MVHPVRTLLFELFVEPLVRLWQRPIKRKVNAPPLKSAVLRKVALGTTRIADRV
jgi:hypothetical protein